MEITYDDFKKVQIKLGTVLSVEKNEKARKPSLVIKVDFGKEIESNSPQLRLHITILKKILLENRLLVYVIFQKRI